MDAAKPCNAPRSNPCSTGCGLDPRRATPPQPAGPAPAPAPRTSALRLSSCCCSSRSAVSCSRLLSSGLGMPPALGEGDRPAPPPGMVSRGGVGVPPTRPYPALGGRPCGWSFKAAFSGVLWCTDTSSDVPPLLLVRTKVGGGTATCAAGVRVGNAARSEGSSHTCSSGFIILQAQRVTVRDAVLATPRGRAGRGAWQRGVAPSHPPFHPAGTRA